MTDRPPVEGRDRPATVPTLSVGAKYQRLMARQPATVSAMVGFLRGLYGPTAEITTAPHAQNGVTGTVVLVEDWREWNGHRDHIRVDARLIEHP